MPVDHKVRDLTLAESGRHQIRLAEHEMPGLMALRAEFGDTKPLSGARIAGSLHMTVQTAVLIETRTALGAEVRWASCNIYSTQDEAAAAVVVGPNGTPEDLQGVPVFAWKGETLEEYWDCTEQFRIFKALVRRTLAQDPQKWTKVAAEIKGVTEETTTGVHRLYQLAEARQLLFPAINVNDSVTKSKFDNKYGCRHSLLDGLNRATDVLIGGKVAVVAGYGDVGKGCAESLRGQGARVIVTEIDPICALQAAMDGYQVATMESVVEQADIIVTATGCFNVVTADHMQQMKNKAILANIGHFDNEIDMAGLAKVPGITKTEIKPQVHEWTFEDGDSIIVLSEGRLMNLGNATGHPSFVMSNSFSNQTIAQVELFTKTDEYIDEEGEPKVETLPKHLDEKVAKLHLEALGVELTELTKEQAEYLGVDVAGPYK